MVDKVKESTDIGDFNHYDHKCLCEIFSIRPYSAAKEKDPFQTNVQYCHYDEVHDDYLYRTDWANYIIDLINNQGWDKERWKENFNNSNKLEIT
ncbi:MAG: hypothetical protein U5Q03_10800 [Bacteroidota bacterium]|nr:hypothetical protein [Bacteroidota bacterium]